MEHPGSLGRFPDGWTDPLDLYGECLDELKGSGCCLDTERDTLKELVKKFGAEWVWSNRKRLASVAKSLKDMPKK